MITLLFASLYFAAVLLFSSLSIKIRRIAVRNNKLNAGLAEYYRRSAAGNYNNRVYKLS